MTFWRAWPTISPCTNGAPANRSPPWPPSARRQRRQRCPLQDEAQAASQPSANSAKPACCLRPSSTERCAGGLWRLEGEDGRRILGRLPQPLRHHPLQPQRDVCAGRVAARQRDRAEGRMKPPTDATGALRAGRCCAASALGGCAAPRAGNNPAAANRSTTPPPVNQDMTRSEARQSALLRSLRRALQGHEQQRPATRNAASHRGTARSFTAA